MFILVDRLAYRQGRHRSTANGNRTGKRPLKNVSRGLSLSAIGTDTYSRIFPTPSSTPPGMLLSGTFRSRFMPPPSPPPSSETHPSSTAHVWPGGQSCRSWPPPPSAATQSESSADHLAADVDKLHSKIGQLVVERDFLAEASHQLLGTRGKKW